MASDSSDSISADSPDAGAADVGGGGGGAAVGGVSALTGTGGGNDGGGSMAAISAVVDWKSSGICSSSDCKHSVVCSRYPPT